MNQSIFNHLFARSLAVLMALVLSVSVQASTEHQHEEQHSESNHGHNELHQDEHDHQEGHKDSHGHKDEHDHEDEHGHDEHEEGQVHISAEQMAISGVMTDSAQAGEIKKVLTLYGRTVLPEQNVSHVSARFAGLITKLTVEVGDKVQAGQKIAEIESNASLKRYGITAPISGVVVSRHGNVGEMVSDKTLVSIVDSSQLWGEFQVFHGQKNRVAVGQKLSVNFEQLRTTSTIQYLLNPMGNEAYLRARVPLDNTEGHWTVGALLSGEVTLSKHNVALAIDNRAIQIMEGQQVVFVRNEEGFEKRIVTLGKKDSQKTELLSGLAEGEEYAVEKSFLLKADLEKSSAGHVH
ncbi:efflux RND transporter periplasmic adaptor subunit [Shewanella sp. ENK2]|uniref:efflux RND transporter periplasmic adaptor subunit n=1 Tax=Shewanella sp. ENK2 TaxID=2775245 RepID=UPI00374801EE